MAKQKYNRALPERNTVTAIQITAAASKTRGTQTPRSLPSMPSPLPRGLPAALLASSLLPVHSGSFWTSRLWPLPPQTARQGPGVKKKGYKCV